MILHAFTEVGKIFLCIMMCEFNIPFSTTGEYPTYQIIGDNVDLHQRASHQTMDRRDSDHHWFHLYAVKDRVTGIGLPNSLASTAEPALSLVSWSPPRNI